MSWKSIVITGLFCVVASPALADPTLVVMPSNAVNANGNREWTISVVPDVDDLPGSLAVELAFSITEGSSANGTQAIINSADNTNGTANDTWYYNETSDGSNTLLWNITGGTSGFPEDPDNEEQNPGDNPFTGTETEGLYVDGANLFASVGSTLFPAPTASVNALHIVTRRGGGILNLLGGSLIAQDGTSYPLAAQSYYVPGDFSGDGVVSSADFNLLLTYFAVPVNTAPGQWDGYAPAGANGSSTDFNRLLQNFGAGQNFDIPAGAGSGGLAGSVVPEPASVALLGLGMILFAARKRRR